ncbi:hypothetical protein GCM10009737_26330 [Nocardioides lentus]|uniref:Glucose/Sorbosone dehydrogenase domain-containing protein n=1 Tax=Nocardioides lentus TaxID=338077 RepID=A0ABN2PJG8_9ACTN
MKTHATVALLAAPLLAAGLMSPALTSAAEPAAPPPGSVTDPVPADVGRGDLGLVLERHHRFPRTQPTPAPTDYRLMRHARINYLGELPDGRQYVPDLNGPLYLLGEDGGRTTYLDLKEEFGDFFSGRGMGSGFGFVAFHPRFATNGRFYTVHTEQYADWTRKETTYPAQPGQFLQSVVTEWTARNPAANRFSGTRREVVRLGFSSQIHAIQQIDFNPTARPGDEDFGLLYLAVGDGGAALRDPFPRELDSPYGKIWRIDPAGDDGPTGTYGIPGENPHVGEEGALGEVYASGMRDPHRFSWDTGGQHRMLLGHIGQKVVESVYEVRAGDNFGWSDLEGRWAYDPDNECYLTELSAEDEAAGYVLPVTSYDHERPAGYDCSADIGQGISGGQVYRGEIAALRGTYVFGDIVDGRVMAAKASGLRQERRGEAPISEMPLLTTDGERVRMTDLVKDFRVDLRVGTDAEGELYLLSKANGVVWKVVDAVRTPWAEDFTPALERDVVAHWDFEHPLGVDGGKEEDQGSSLTLLDLVNGGWASRVADGAHPGSRNSIRTRQVDPVRDGDDDWKAGVWDEAGVESLRPFASNRGTTVMGWFKVTGDLPAADTTTPDPGDRYNAVGLAGILSGDSDGHGVRALLELIDVDGELSLVALGRRLDGGASQTFAADRPWQEILPRGRWVHLAATFDFTTGRMALYQDGERLRGRYTTPGDPWQVDGTGTSPTLPRGVKIGGSFPQDTRERNPCDCRIDDVALLDVAATPAQVRQQYRRWTR